mmetsp:Transcript_148723/g.361086  ORF Transcript_148723/g.361086 Transcript_148723/m.361086 type:complete len:269 (+) Transcript_148723:141-947(+)
MAGKASQALLFSACICTSSGCSGSTYSQRPDWACRNVAPAPQRNSSCLLIRRPEHRSCQPPPRSTARPQPHWPPRNRYGMGKPSCSKANVASTSSPALRSGSGSSSSSSSSYSSSSSSSSSDFSAPWPLRPMEWQMNIEAGSSVMMTRSGEVVSNTVRKRFDRCSCRKMRASCTGAGSGPGSSAGASATAGPAVGAPVTRSARRWASATSTSRRGRGESARRLRQAGACERIAQSSFSCRAVVLREATLLRKSITSSLDSRASNASGS